MTRLLHVAAALAAILGSAQAAAEEPAKDPTVVFKLSNLTDATQATEVKKLETAVKKVKDVKSVAVNKKKGEIKITHKEGADLAAIRKAVASAGFTIVDPKPAGDADPAPTK